MTSPVQLELYIKLNGGAPTSGVVTAAYSDSVVLSAASTGTGARRIKYRIRAFPPGFACPAGWTTEGKFYVATVQSGGDAPAFALPSAPSALWGKFIFDATRDGQLYNGRTVGEYIAKARLKIPSTSGVDTIAYLEDDEFDAFGWTKHLDTLARRYDEGLPGAGDVAGDTASTSGNIARMHGVGGKAIRDDGIAPDELNLTVARYGARPSASAAANVIALTAACAAAAAAGATLYWPAGNYQTNASIPLLHTVEHRGPGKIVRGSDTFAVEPKPGNTNRIYVAPAPTGNNGNDGLTSSQPRATIQSAFDAITIYGPVLVGNWRVEVAAGTYTNQPVAVDGLQSANYIVVAGATVAMNATPTVRFDGTGATAVEAMSFDHNMRVKVEHIRIQNWSVVDSAGLVARHRTQLWAYNVHAHIVNESGLYAQAESRLYVQGGVFTSCSKGIRVAQGSTFTIGQGGDVVVCQNCEYGAHLRNQSGGVVVNAEFRNCTVFGVQLLHSSEARFTNCLFNANAVGLNVTGSAWYDDGNTFTGNTVDVETSQHSGELDESFEYFYDYATKKHGWGGGAARFAPGPKYHFRHLNSGGAFHSGAHMGIEAANPIYSFLTDNVSATAFGGFYWGKPGNTSIGQLLYRYDDNSFRMTVNGIAAFRWGQTYYYPGVDNTVSLGLGAGSGRWTTVYATTGAINTSDEREKEQIEAIPDALLDAWAEVDFVRYKWRDAVEKKSSGARWHYGVIAQRIEAVFRRHGVDPFAQGLLCYDEWEAKDAVWEDIPEERDKSGKVVTPATRELREPAVEAGNRYGIRYEEALILEAALMRRELQRLRKSA